MRYSITVAKRRRAQACKPVSALAISPRIANHMEDE